MAQDRREGRGGQRTVSEQAWADRFPPTAYGDLPDMPIAKGDVTLLLELLNGVEDASATTALCITGFLAAHQGKYTGFAMQRRTNLLTITSASDAAMRSARQYAAIAPLMGSKAAEPSARLDVAEMTILRFIHGHRVSWTSLIDKLTRLRLEFQGIADTGVYGGRTAAALAYVYLCQSNSQPDTEVGRSKRTILYDLAVEEFQRAIVLLGIAFHVEDLVETVRATAPELVKEVIQAGNGATTGRISQPA